MNIGLVLEGGAMRGLFTAGVMDVLMEYGAEFDAIVGVSAGAAFGVNYKSKQIGRVIRYNKRFANDKRYCSVQSLLNTGNLFNAMFCYHTVPNELDKFDRERYNADKTPFYVVCTDAETGEPVYHLLDRANDWGFEWIRASASMPLVSKPVKIDGKYYLDGGMSDSIPIEFMIVGGCASSTGGGVKVIRVILTAKLIKRSANRRIRSKALDPIKVGGKTVSEHTLTQTAQFMMLFAMTVIIGTVLVSLDGFSLSTSLSSVVATLCNIGPGFDLVGPSMNFALFSGPIKILLSLFMIAGRLELYTIVLMFTPVFWDENR